MFLVYLVPISQKYFRRVTEDSYDQEKVIGNEAIHLREIRKKNQFCWSKEHSR